MATVSQTNFWDKKRIEFKSTPSSTPIDITEVYIRTPSQQTQLLWRKPYQIIPTITNKECFDSAYVHITAHTSGQRSQLDSGNIAYYDANNNVDTGWGQIYYQLSTNVEVGFNIKDTYSTKPEFIPPYLEIDVNNKNSIYIENKNSYGVTYLVYEGENTNPVASGSLAGRTQTTIANLNYRTSYTVVFSAQQQWRVTTYSSKVQLNGTDWVSSGSVNNFTLNEDTTIAIIGNSTTMSFDELVQTSSSIKTGHDIPTVYSTSFTPGRGTTSNLTIERPNSEVSFSYIARGYANNNLVPVVTKTQTGIIIQPTGENTRSFTLSDNDNFIWGWEVELWYDTYLGYPASSYETIQILLPGDSLGANHVIDDPELALEMVEASGVRYSITNKFSTPVYVSGFLSCKGDMAKYSYGAPFQTDEYTLNLIGTDTDHLSCINSNLEFNTTHTAISVTVGNQTINNIENSSRCPYEAYLYVKLECEGYTPCTKDLTLSQIFSRPTLAWEVEQNKVKLGITNVINNALLIPNYKIWSGEEQEPSNWLSGSLTGHGETIYYEKTPFDSTIAHGRAFWPSQPWWRYSITSESDANFFAIYTLHINTNENENVTVSRTSSPYASAPCEELHDGSPIYYGDSLSGSHQDGPITWDNDGAYDTLLPVSVTDTSNLSEPSHTITNPNECSVDVYYTGSYQSGAKIATLGSNQSVKVSVGLEDEPYQWGDSYTYDCEGYPYRHGSCLLAIDDGSYTGTDFVTGDVIAEFSYQSQDTREPKPTLDRSASTVQKIGNLISLSLTNLTVVTATRTPELVDNTLKTYYNYDANNSQTFTFVCETPSDWHGIKDKFTYEVENSSNVTVTPAIDGQRYVISVTVSAGYTNSIAITASVTRNPKTHTLHKYGRGSITRIQSRYNSAAPLGELENNATLYYGDELSINPISYEVVGEWFPNSIAAPTVTDISTASGPKLRVTNPNSDYDIPCYISNTGYGSVPAGSSIDVTPALNHDDDTPEWGWGENVTVWLEMKKYHTIEYYTPDKDDDYPDASFVDSDISVDFSHSCTYVTKQETNSPLVSASGSIYVGNWITLSLTDFTSTETCYQYKTSAQDIEFTFTTPSSWHADRNGFTYTVSISSSVGSISTQTVYDGQQYTVTLTIPAGYVQPITITGSIERSPKSYTLTVTGNGTVIKTGDYTGPISEEEVLANGSTIHYGDILSTRTDDYYSYSSWTPTSISAPTVMDNSSGSTPQFAIYNPNNYSCVVWDNNRSVGNVASESTCYDTGNIGSGEYDWSWGITKYYSLKVQQTRTKYTWSETSDSYSGTSKVTGDVTAEFKFASDSGVTENGNFLTSQSTAGQLGNWISLNLTNLSGTECCYPYKTTESSIVFTFTTPSSWHSNKSYFNYSCTFSSTAGTTISAVETTVGQTYTVTLTIPARTSTPLSIVGSVTRSPKSYTLTIVDNGSTAAQVWRCGDYEGQWSEENWQRLYNGATIYYGDILQGVNGGKATATDWAPTSISDPVLTDVSNASNAIVSVYNPNTFTTQAWNNSYNYKVADIGGQSSANDVGQIGSGDTDWSWGQTNSYYMKVQKTRTYYFYTPNNDNFSSVSCVTRNVTATFNYTATGTSEVQNGAWLTSATKSITLGNICSFNVTGFNATDSFYFPYKSTEETYTVVLNTPSSWHDSLNAYNYITSFTGPSGVTVSGTANTVGKKYTVSITIPAYTNSGITIVCSITRSVKSYTLTISGSGTVSRTDSPYKGASTTTLSNNATIYYGDVLSGEATASYSTYGDWYPTSLTAPTVTDNSSGSTPQFAIYNPNNYAGAIWNDSNNSIGNIAAEGTCYDTGNIGEGEHDWSWGVIKNYKIHVQQRRNKYNYIADSDCYTGTDGVTGNVTATFTHSLSSTTTDWGTYIDSGWGSGQLGNWITLNLSNFSGTECCFPYKTSQQTITITLTTPSDWHSNRTYFNYTTSATASSGVTAAITENTAGQTYTLTLTIDAQRTSSIQVNASISRTPKSYTLTISGSGTVNRTSSPYAGASIAALSNGATIYYGDVLTGTSSPYYTYGDWSPTSVTAPTVTNTSTYEPRCSISNPNNFSCKVYQNFSPNSQVGNSAIGYGGSVEDVGTIGDGDTDWSWGSRLGYVLKAQQTRTANYYAANSGNYSGTNGVTGNVTANFGYTYSSSSTEHGNWIESAEGRCYITQLSPSITLSLVNLTGNNTTYLASSSQQTIDIVVYSSWDYPSSDYDYYFTCSTDVGEIRRTIITAGYQYTIHLTVPEKCTSNITVSATLSRTAISESCTRGMGINL